MIDFCSEASEFLPVPLGFWENVGHRTRSVRLEFAQCGISEAAKTRPHPRSLGNANY